MQGDWTDEHGEIVTIAGNEVRPYNFISRSYLVYIKRIKFYTCTYNNLTLALCLTFDPTLALVIES